MNNNLNSIVLKILNTECINKELIITQKVNKIIEVIILNKEHGILGTLYLLYNK